MASIVRDGLVACIDCTVAIANDDFTGLSDELETSVRAGIARLSKQGYLVIGDELGFVDAGCDVCLDGLAGDKHSLAILGD